MADSYMTDITDFLDENGEIAIESGAGLGFAVFLTSIISMVSHPQPAPDEFNVKCRCRPKRKPCKGIIQGDINPEIDMILWWCPECLESGYIMNWQDTLWDLSEADGAVH